MPFGSETVNTHQQQQQQQQRMKKPHDGCATNIPTIGVSLDTPLIGKIENEIKMNDLTDQ